MDKIDFKTIMPNENHMYMDEIFGWMWSMNELLDDNWKYTNFLDENSNWLNVWMKVIPKQLWQMEITIFT